MENIITTTFMEDILEKACNGSYSSKVPYPKSNLFPVTHVIDENKSVKWNKEAVAEYNNEILRQKEAYRKSMREGESRFKADCIKYITQETGLSEVRAERIFDFVNQKYSCYSMLEVCNEIEEMLYLFRED